MLLNLGTKEKKLKFGRVGRTKLQSSWQCSSISSSVAEIEIHQYNHHYSTCRFSLPLILNPSRKPWKTKVSFFFLQKTNISFCRRRRLLSFQLTFPDFSSLPPYFLSGSLTTEIRWERINWCHHTNMS